MSPTHALLGTPSLGQNTVLAGRERPEEGSLTFSCREAGLILLNEKGVRYSPARQPLLLDRCVIFRTESTVLRQINLYQGVLLGK